MREIFILSCWPNTRNRENMLVDLITKLKKLNKEVLIASHYLVPDYIVNMADYYIYDKENIIFTDKTLDNYPADYYFENTSFRVEGISINHSAALSRILNISLNFVKNLGYDYFSLLESDVVFDFDDLKKFDEIKLSTIKENKKFFFFKLRPYQFPYWENNGIFEVYETCYFGGFVKNFLSRMNFPVTLEEWNKLLKEDAKNHTLEYFVTSTFKSVPHECLILDSVRHVFTKSQINTSTVLGMDGIYCNSRDENSLVLFLQNESSNKRTFKMHSSVFMPMMIHNTFDVNGHCWMIHPIDITKHNADLRINVYENGVMINSINELLDRSWVERNRKRRRIIYK
jgi:hypothetical protein